MQEAVIKTVPKEKKCKKAKWLSEEVLQIAKKRREAKGKGEKKRYIYLNAELQRIARRDKKAFLSDQCKEIKENNRMGKTKGTLHAKMGTIKVRNSMDLGEADGEGSGTPLQYSAWQIPWAEEPGGLPSMGSHRVRHD